MLAIVRLATMCAFIGSLSRPLRRKRGVGGGTLCLRGRGQFLGIWSHKSTKKIFIQPPRLQYGGAPPSPPLLPAKPWSFPQHHSDWMIDSPLMSLVLQTGQCERQHCGSLLRCLVASVQHDWNTFVYSFCTRCSFWTTRWHWILKRKLIVRDTCKIL